MCSGLMLTIDELGKELKFLLIAPFQSPNCSLSPCPFSSFNMTKNHGS